MRNLCNTFTTFPLSPGCQRNYDLLDSNKGGVCVVVVKIYKFRTGNENQERKKKNRKRQYIKENVEEELGLKDYL